MSPKRDEYAKEMLITLANTCREPSDPKPQLYGLPGYVLAVEAGVISIKEVRQSPPTMTRRHVISALEKMEAQGWIVQIEDPEDWWQYHPYQEFFMGLYEEFSERKVKEIHEKKRHLDEQWFKLTAKGMDRFEELTLRAQPTGWLFSEREPMPGDLNAVTLLYERRIFDQELPMAVSSSQTDGFPVCCLMLDLDGFKAINETYGHPKGDEVLRGVADRIQLIVRGKGRAYKYGGEEFVALLWNHTVEEGKAVAERIRESVEAFQIQSVDQPITVSIGVAVYPHMTSSSTQLLEYADQALLTAKQKGRNQVQVYLSPHLEAQRGALPVASDEEIASVLRYVTSLSIDVRRDAMKELLELSYKKRLAHSEEVLTAIGKLLSDPDAGIREEGLQLFEAVLLRADADQKRALVDGYFNILLRLAQHDPSVKVRARSMTTIGVTGDERFIEWIVYFICHWDEETYSQVGPVVALNGLKHWGLAEKIRERLRQALEGSISPETTKRLKGCLEHLRTA